MRSSVVSDGVAALRALRDAASAGTPFDLAFLDYRLPITNGIELAREIKAVSQINEVPLILMSGYDPPPRAELAKAQFVRFLEKPLRRSQLFDSIAETLHRTQKAQAGIERPALASASPTVLAGKQSARILLVEDNGQPSPRDPATPKTRIRRIFGIQRP